jgi:8-amino-7-oxononanoate synthase
MSLLAEHRGLLDALATRGRLRALKPTQGIDFASNDYLGLARSDLIRDIAAQALQRGVAPGAGAARLLRGNDPEFEELEAEAARHFGAPSALFLANGYTANLAIFSALPQTRDLVLHDELIHASARDGLRLGAAEARPFRHNDPTAAQDAIRTWRAGGGKGHVWIAVESLYSMDGDRAPLGSLAEIAREEGAFLIIDEAHATGVWGPSGRGLAAPFAPDENAISLHTCGKALGTSGALVCLSPILREVLINRARSFIYSTAPSPLTAAIIRGTLAHLEADPTRRETLLRRVRLLDRLAALAGIPATGSQILPIVLGSDARALGLSGRLATHGFDLRAIRSPTVPKGGERLRLSLTLNAAEADLTALFTALAPLLKEAA